MGALDELLELQDHDTVIDQLEHRLGTLEERGTLERIDSEIVALALVTTGVEEERHVQSREQSQLEDAVLMVEEKREREEAKLYDGSVTAIKELQALQDEIASLKRRQSSLEDDLLDVLEIVEPLDRRLDEMAAEAAQRDSEQAEAAAALDLAEADTRTGLENERVARSESADGVPEEMLAEYVKLRERFKGVGVARLSKGSCMGCHLALSAVEVDRIRKEPADAMIHCGECGRLLVR
jgi:predicted  nucleic acid-binding Zn-ribbon protein